MAYIPPNPNGQATSANSAPVVIASDQNSLSVQGTATTITSATWTSATAVNTALSISISGMNTVSLAMTNTSTMTAGVLTFEISPNNVNWFPIAMARIDSYTVETTYTLNTVANRAWSTSADGFTNFRVRLSTVITGTGSATLILKPETFAIEPIVTVGQSVAASLQTTATLAAGANVIGKVNVSAAISGGATSFTLISAATTNATLVKGSSGTLYMLSATNNSATVAFIKLYNLTVAPTVGTSTPVMTFMIPANGGVMVPVPATGINFTTGISYALTGLATLADTTAVALSQIQVNGAYL